MPTNLEIKTSLKTQLFDLLKRQKETGDTTILQPLILKTMAAMEQEDVAYVEKLVEKLK